MPPPSKRRSNADIHVEDRVLVQGGSNDRTRLESQIWLSSFSSCNRSNDAVLHLKSPVESRQMTSRAYLSDNLAPPCTSEWHDRQSVIRFCSESSPPRLRKSLWCTSRLDLVPQAWHLQPSRRSTWLRSRSYNSGSRRRRERLGGMRFTTPSRSLRAEKPAFVRREGT
jgi:hypothetical protein